ncbi:MAG: hypothetical protein Q4E91_03510 [Lachnospiraceae bacterium]|nr:hypothetical protein [Lachnospiraceae bacterium]
MSLTREDLQAIAELMDEKLEPLKKDFTDLKSDVSSLQSDVSEIKLIVNKNYSLTEEFYVKQKEANTEAKDRIKVITGELEMHNEQISRNTADIELYK